MPKPKTSPATDEEIAKLRQDIATYSANHPERVVAPAMSMILRIEADRATIDKQVEEFAELGAAGRLFVPADVIDRLIARIESEKAANAELRADKSAFVEMNAVFEAVMRAIRGEPLSEFDLSHGAVYEAQMLREANNAHARITADLRARLAEVSQAAMAVVSNSDMATPPTIAAMAALEAILAKGDKS